MPSVSYRVSFPGPVGKVNGGLAGTVLVVEASRSKEVLEQSLGEQLVKYLRGVQAISSKSVSCHLNLLDDLDAGSGRIFAGPSTIKQVRVGSFQLERFSDAGAA